MTVCIQNEIESVVHYLPISLCGYGNVPGTCYVRASILASTGISHPNHPDHQF